jgi:outer membrane protein assembly factor BamE
MSFIIPWGRRVGLLIAAGALAACSALPSRSGLASALTPYRIEVVQGNVVTREMAAAVRPGMSRTQVREILGSPLLADIFHADRWDYMFTIRRQGTEPQRRRVTAHFDGETLARLESDDLPGEEEFVASIDTFAKRRAPELTLSEAQLQALPAPRREAEPDTTPTAPTRRYPPLEPVVR